MAKRRFGRIIAFLAVVLMLCIAMTACGNKKGGGSSGGEDNSGGGNSSASGGNNENNDKNPTETPVCQHEYLSEVTFEASCVAEGTLTYTCRFCSEKYTEAISKIEHTEVVDKGKAPTCTENGLSDGKHCTECGEVTLEPEILDMLAHEYSEDFKITEHQHFYECKCGAKNGESAHISSGAPTAVADEVCTACGYIMNEAVGLLFDKLTFVDKIASVRVTKDIDTYSISDKVITVGSAEYSVSLDAEGKKPLSADSIALNFGDNTVYITSIIKGEAKDIYTLTVRRAPVWTVSFNSAGGSAVEVQEVEEGGYAQKPASPTRLGYTFSGWDFDFTKAINADTEIFAKWTANSGIAYRVEYYLENIYDSDYSLDGSDLLFGTTDLEVTAVIKGYDYFVYNPTPSTVKGTVTADGSLVLKVYYTRNVYTISNAKTEQSENGGVSYYKHGATVRATAVPDKLGYAFDGWYSNGSLISSNETDTFTVTADIEARFKLRDDMSSFAFTGTENELTITKLFDKNVKELIIPDGVTAIAPSVFEGCKKLWRVVLPDSVVSIGESAFANCPELVSVTVGKGLKSVGKYAFYGSNKLVEVINKSDLTVTCGSSNLGCLAYYALAVHSEKSYVEANGGYLFYTNGYCLLLGYTGDSQTLYMPQSYNGQKYEIYPYAFYDRDDISAVSISSGVFYIHKLAFYGCDGIKSLTIPSSVQGIMDSAFSDCTGLKTLTLGSGIEEMGETVFGGCSALTSVTLNNGIAFIGNSAFYGCESLTKITIPASVKSIGEYAFDGCASLAEINFGTGVTSIGDYAFYSCTGLETITVPKNVTSIGEAAFSFCENLKEIVVPFVGESANAVSFKSHFGYIFGYTCSESNTSDSIWYDSKYYTYHLPTELERVSVSEGITRIENNAFYKCSGLESVELPSTVKEIGQYAFYNCVSLTDVSLPAMLNEIEQYSFYGCKSLKDVSISDNLTYIGYCAFATCQSLKNIYVSAGNSSYKDINGSLYSKDGKTLILYAPGKTDENFVFPTGVQRIEKNAFNGCQSLKSVTLCDGIKSVSAYSFNNCTSLTSVYIPDGVEAINEYAFSNCTSLTSIAIPGSVELIGRYAFSGCASLVEATLGDGVKTLRDYVFGECKNLARVTIPDSIESITSYTFDGCSALIYNEYSNAKYLGNEKNPYVILASAKNTAIESCEINPNTKIIQNSAFNSCRKLTSILIPASVKTIGNGAFSQCKSLTSFSTGNTVVQISSDTFSYCTSLVSVTIGKSVNQIDQTAFEGCTALTSFSVNSQNTSYEQLDGNLYTKDGNTLIRYASGKTDSYFEVPYGTQKIGNYAFHECGNLYNVYIPGSVKSIGHNAFAYCSNLTDVTFSNGVTSIGDYAFYDCVNLARISLPYSVTSIGSYAFYKCTSLTSVVIPDSVTSIESYAFYYCTNLKMVEIPSSVDYIGRYAFYPCNSLTVYCEHEYEPSGWDREWNYSGCPVVWGYVKEFAFEYSYDGSYVTVTDYVGTGSYVVIPSEFGGVPVKEIGSYAFEYCYDITEVIIPDSITYISSYAFYYCTNLKTVEIPSSVDYIGWYAFYSCNSLTVYCEHEYEPSGWDSEWNYSGCPVIWGYNG